VLTIEDDISSGDVSFASLYQYSQKIAKQCHQLVDDFEKANERTINIDISDLLNNNWDDQNKETAKLLNIGMIVGMAKVQALMDATKEPVYDGPGEVISQSWYREDENVTFGWGRLAKKQGKAVRKALKAGQTVNVA
jgi:hypothetical protein